MATVHAQVRRIRAALTPSEWSRVGGMAGAVVGLHVLGWGLLAAALHGHYHISKTGIIGPGVSGTFLYLIAALNLIVLAGILKVFREMRQGAYNDTELEEQLAKRGLMNRILGPLARRVDTPWKIYPVGVLFGLGFD